MTTPLLLEDLRRDEGCRLRAYQDTAGVWTIGYGHTGGVRPIDVWTQPQAEAALQADLTRIEAGLDWAAPWWRGQSEVRQDVLAEMAFNLGVSGLMGFHRTLAAVRCGSYAEAAADMLQSAWAGEVGERAVRLAGMMRSGARAAG